MMDFDKTVWRLVATSMLYCAIMVLAVCLHMEC